MARVDERGQRLLAAARVGDVLVAAHRVAPGLGRDAAPRLGTRGHERAEFDATGELVGLAVDRDRAVDAHRIAARVLGAQTTDRVVALEPESDRIQRQVAARARLALIDVAL